MTKSSYKKLKEENEGLKKDLYRIVMKHDEIETQALIMRYRLKFSLSEMFFSGTADHLKGYNDLQTTLGIAEYLKT